MNNDILFKEQPCKKNENLSIGHITINRPKALNSLSFELIESMYQRLMIWQDNPQIIVVIIDAAGEKAFSAGGDIKQIYNNITGKDHSSTDFAKQYFSQEYALNYLIRFYRKPIIAWGDGIIMGGGLGIFAACQFKIVTENSLLAMPEVTIGLFPDVGATWFLNQMPNRIGLFLGLTGAKINSHDALLTNLADFFITHQQKALFIEALCQLDFSANKNSLDENAKLIFNTSVDFSQASKRSLPESNIANNLHTIDTLTKAHGCVDVVNKLISYQGENTWLKSSIANLTKGCPTTMHLVFQQLQRGKYLSFKEIQQMELNIAVNCTKLNDFKEGVRALLIEKDGQPQWQFNKVTSVPAEHINKHFKQI